MAARAWLGVAAHAAAGRSRTTQQAPCPPHHPWLCVQHRQQQRQRQPVCFRQGQAAAGREYRVARFTLAAAASSVTNDALESEGHNGGVQALLRPLSNGKANAKLLALCGAQLLASVATLLHDTYLPLYLSEVLHMSNTKMGNLHALLQFLAKATGIISGRLSDFLPPSRMVVLGTLLTALCKPAFGLAGIVHSALGTGACVSWIASAKIVDRACKGIREAPSKVFIAQLAAQSGDSAGAAFSLRYAFSTLGMLLGASAASLAFHLSHRNFVLTFAMSALPAALALLLVATALGRDTGEGIVAAGGGLGGEGLPALEVPAGSDDETAMPSGALDKLAAFLGTLTPPFWQALVTVFLLYIARFDTSFLILHARTVMEEASLPMLTPFAMVPVVLLAPSMGLRAKTSVHARNTVIQLGIGMLVLSNLAFMLLPSPAGCFLGSIFVGVHMAMTQGVTTGMLAAYIPSCTVPGLGRVCGAVWAFVDLLLGIALACSNVLAGRLSDLTARRGMGNTGCFLGGLVACLLSMLALAMFSSLGELGREDRVPAIQPVATGSFG